jgi:hypothetical protein
MADAGVVGVAAVRTCTIVGKLPNTLRGIISPSQSSHSMPPSVLYSISVVIPVIASRDPLYDALGVTGRAGTLTLRASDADAAPVAVKRIQ